ncbi:MAG: hypothetical protein ACJAZV_002234, partial [Roseivirga sp.]
EVFISIGLTCRTDLGSEQPMLKSDGTRLVYFLKD